MSTYLLPAYGLCASSISSPPLHLPTKLDKSKEGKSEPAAIQDLPLLNTRNQQSSNVLTMSADQRRNRTNQTRKLRKGRPGKESSRAYTQHLGAQVFPQFYTTQACEPCNHHAGTFHLLYEATALAGRCANPRRPRPFDAFQTCCEGVRAPWDR